MTVYYKRPSERVAEGEPNRIARNFRLHPDRLADLDEVARAWNVTKARALEQLIEAAAQHLIQRSLFGGIAEGEKEPEDSTGYRKEDPADPVVDCEHEAALEREAAYRASRPVPKTPKRKPRKEGKKS